MKLFKWLRGTNRSDNEVVDALLILSYIVYILLWIVGIAVVCTIVYLGIGGFK